MLLGRPPLTSEGAGPGTTRWRACCDDGVYGVVEANEVVGRGAHWCEAMQRPSPCSPPPHPGITRSPAVGDSPAWGCVTRVEAGPDPSLSKGSPGVLPRGGLPPPLPLLTLGRLLGMDGTCAEAYTQQQAKPLVTYHSGRQLSKATKVSRVGASRSHRRWGAGIIVTFLPKPHWCAIHVV